MTAVETDTTSAYYAGREAELLARNVQTKAYYHDLVHKNIHLAFPPDENREQLTELRRRNALEDVEFSVREELGLSYPFPNYVPVTENGRTRLLCEGYGYIDDMFNPDGPRAKDWPESRKRPDSINYRRASLEYRSIVDFQESAMLKQAKPGDTFIWTSPTVYDIHLDEKLSTEQKKALLDKVCYGFHTFIFTYTMQEDGELHPRVHTTYLNPKGIRSLYQSVYGEDKTLEFPDDRNLDMHLLGKVEALPASADRLQETIEALQQDPRNMFDLPQEVASQKYEIAQADTAIAECRPLANYYYFLQQYANGRDISYPEVQQLIDRAYQRWRQATYARLAQQDCPELQNFLGLDERDIEQLASMQVQEIRRAYLRALNGHGGLPGYTQSEIPAHLLAAAYNLERMAIALPDAQEVVTGCGLGSGFADAARSSALFSNADVGFTTSYEGASALFGGKGSESKMWNGVDRKACITCPSCGNKKNNKTFYKKGQVVGYECGGCHASTMRS